MPDAIAFRCTNCKKAYRVGLAHAGRVFQCTNCKAHLTVPQSSTNSGVMAPLPESVAPEVDMDAGDEVVFKQTDSQRRASIDPTRVFTRERETGLTQPAVVQQKSGKGLLIAVIAVVVLGGAGAAAFFMPSDNSTGNSDVVGTNTSTDNSASDKPIEKTLSQKLLEESDQADVTPKRLLSIINEASKANLSKPTLEKLYERAIGKISSAQGGELSNKALFAFAGQLERDGNQDGAASTYHTIIGRESGKDAPSDDLKKAHEKLGDFYFNLDQLESRLLELGQWPFLSGTAELKSDLESLKERTDGNWLNQKQIDEAKAIAADLAKIQTEFDTIKNETPFRLDIVEIEAEFRKSLFARLRNWQVIADKPFVFFMQSGIDEFDGKRLMENFQEFHAFFVQEFVKPLSLKRAQPSNIADQAKRDDAPIVFFLLNDRKVWRDYLRAFAPKAAIDTDRYAWYTEYRNGRVSGAYDGGASTETNIIRGMRTVMIDYYHPLSPNTVQATGTMANRFNSYALSRGFGPAMLCEAEDDDGNTTYLVGSKTRRVQMSNERKPFSWNGSRAGTFGGPIVTPKQMVTSHSAEELMGFARENINGYGWNEEALEWMERIFAPEQANNINAVTEAYTREFLSFLFHFKASNELKYRKEFLEWFHAEIKGEITAENQAASFEKIFEVKNDADWKKMDEDFAVWCAQDE